MFIGILILKKFVPPKAPPPEPGGPMPWHYWHTS